MQRRRVDFIHAAATDLTIADLLSPPDVPQVLIKELFPFHRKINYTAHSSPIMAVQVTELADGIFIGCAICHAVVDGTSLWNFFNTFAEVSRGVTRASNVPDFRRESILVSKVALPVAGSRESIQKLKARVNHRSFPENVDNTVELVGKMSNDPQQKTVTSNETVTKNVTVQTTEISSFQSLCALTWRCVTRARNLEGSKTTTFRMAVNVRQRLEPKLGEYYFGNAIQSIATCAAVGDVVCGDLRWCAEELNKNVKAYDSSIVRRVVENWEREPKIFELGNHDGATVQMGSSPRFPMYDNDFGWGKPFAVRSGGANKFDGKISAFPGRKGGGAVDLEMVLAPQTMARLESDPEFMLFASAQA
ncbi:Transferase [Sesbania bispinosa]|nr:Transferase [Sesbania bispinosa]